MDDAHWDKDRRDYFGVLSQLNCDYIDSGKYKDAFSLSLEMVDTYKQMYQSNTEFDKSLYSTCLSNLAETYSYLGDYEKSIELAKEALELVKDNDFECPIIMNNLANYYDEIGQYEKALEMQNNLMAIISRYLSEDNEEFIISIALMGRYLVHSGNINEGLSYLIKAKELWIDHQDISNPYFYHILSSLANAYKEDGRYEDAIKLNNGIRIIYKQIFGDNHPYVISANLDLLLLHTLTQNCPEIKDVLNEVLPFISNNIRYNFSFLPLNDRVKFWDGNKFMLRIIPVLNYRFPELDITEEGYNACLFSKGILLNSERTFDDFLSAINNSDLQKMYSDIKELRQNINGLYSYPISERTVKIDSLENHLYSSEIKLMNAAAKYGNYAEGLHVDWRDVRNNLKEDDVALEFVAINNNYIAYVLRENFDKPILIDMFSESMINQFDSKNIYKSLEAGKLIWGKLAPYLEGVKNVYFAPDGMLKKIAIEYLPNLDGDGIMSERYNFHRLSSTREIALSKNQKTTNDAVLYGGIIYDTDVSSMETESRKYSSNMSRGTRSTNSLLDSLSSRGGVGYLEYTKTEVEQIYNMLNDKSSESVLFSGINANEESFKNLSGKGNGIIHIATHGFYWEKDEAEYEASMNDKLRFMLDMGNSDKRSAEDRALTRTGLYMAGANNILKGKEIPESVEDGILTAQEIASLDLRGLDLVVLSACETGMGDISGDGVFGLQRGFKKAGANSILMSLWDVDDKATQILMTEFYKNYLSGMSKYASLKEAQKSLRTDPKYSDPVYWAAFILLDGLN